MREMRRIDREVTDLNKIREVLSKCQVVRLGLQDGKGVYVVPVNFGYVEDGGHFTLYFHGATEGRKAELIAKNGCAGFEMDTGSRIYGEDTACTYTSAFHSIIGEGTVAAVETVEEKRTGFLALMRHTTGKDQWEFEDRMLAAAAVFRLDVTEYRCKEHL